MKEIKEIEIETTSAHTETRTFFCAKDGLKITIGKNDLDFFEKLQALPYGAKIKLMGLSEQEMLDFIAWRKKSELTLLIELLNSRWYTRSDGDEIDYNFEFVPGMGTFSEVKKRCNSKRPPVLKVIQQWIDYLAGESSELYRKEDRE